VTAIRDPSQKAAFPDTTTLLPFSSNTSPPVSRHASIAMIATRSVMEGCDVKYASGQTMRVGDAVIADGMTGEIVCDFEHREFAEGYEGWDMPEVEMLDGGKLDSGVMIETVEAGLIHYPSGTGDITLVLRDGSLEQM
jgi:hypothetical protein